MPKHVLIADDDTSIRSSLTRLIASMGHTSDEAGNYIDIRALMDAKSYDLIVCDNRMPLSPGSTRTDSTCGLQLLAHANMSKYLERTPFVLHTSDDDEKTKRLAEEFGGIYLQKASKPSPGELIEKLLADPPVG